MQPFPESAKCSHWLRSEKARAELQRDMENLRQYNEATKSLRRSSYGMETGAHHLCGADAHCQDAKIRMYILKVYNNVGKDRCSRGKSQNNCSAHEIPVHQVPKLPATLTSRCEEDLEVVETAQARQGEGDWSTEQPSNANTADVEGQVPLKMSLTEQETESACVR